jgi:acyl-CoA thioester hydrolase
LDRYKKFMTANHTLAFSDYPHRAETDIRHSDTDRLGHVNNVAFAAFLEFGRASLLHNMTSKNPVKGHAFVIVRLEIDYRAEMRWPGKVQIGVGVTRIGRSSFASRQTMFNNGNIVAEAVSVLVLMNEATRKSAPLPPEIVAALEALSLPE